MFAPAWFATPLILSVMLPMDRPLTSCIACFGKLSLAQRERWLVLWFRVELGIC